MEFAPFVRSAFNYDQDAASDEAGLSCPEPTLAQQHQAEEADINNIVKRFGITGTVPNIPLPPPLAEFGDIFDFRSAMDVLNAAKASFMQLPADVRRRFGNDPAEFVDFCSNADNLDEMRRMGLAVPKKEPEPDPAPQRVIIVGGEDGKDGTGK